MSRKRPPGVPHVPPQAYDLIAPLESLGDSYRDQCDFGLGVINSLKNKGYCTVQLPLDKRRWEQVECEIAALEETGKFFQPPAEVVDGLLGEAGSTRIAYLPDPPVQEVKGEILLLSIDAHLDAIANTISPWTSEAFGFSMDSRTTGLLNESGVPRDFFPSITQVSALQWYKTFTSHRIMCLVFLGPPGGILEMQPFDEDSYVFEIDTAPGMCIFLRADTLSHKFSAPEESYTLSCWFLQEMSPIQRLLDRPCFTLTPVAKGLDKLLNQPPEEDILEAEVFSQVPRELQRQLHHRHAGKTAVRAAACKLPEHIDFWSMNVSFVGGGDVAAPIPFTRWDPILYYDPGQHVSIHCKHCGAVEGWDLFDHVTFGLSPTEVETFAAEERQVLEVGYEVMYYAGFTKADGLLPCQRFTMADVDKIATGVYLGATWNEWGNARKAIDCTQQGISGNTSGNPAGRVSYILGLKGTSLSLDTENASSLMAVCCGSDDLHRPKEIQRIDRSLCLSVSFLLSHKVLADHAARGWLSQLGRCRTFDDTADGHVLGDALAGVLLTPNSEALQTEMQNDADNPVLGLISATEMGNSRCSASLITPSPPAMQQLLRAAIRTARLSAWEVDAVECHGASQPMGDSLEVLSLTRVLCEGRTKEEVLLLGAAKSGLTHSRAAGGLSGLLKTLVAQSWGWPPPSLHLRRQNPQMEWHLLEGSTGNVKPLHLLTETAEVIRGSSFGCVTSYGSGGSVAHVVAWGAVEEKLRLGPLRRPVQTHVDIVFWPGGSQEQELEQLPEKYCIVGSWNSWNKAEEMEEEQPGIFGHTVTLGEHRLERFYICLDGDMERVLHPSIPEAPANDPPFGPHKCAGDLCWAIDGRRQLREYEDDTEPPKDPHLDTANPGDRFRVRLCKSGKYCTVNWSRLPEEAGVARGGPCGLRTISVPARYFISSTWNAWQMDEMEPHPTIPGLYHRDVLLIHGCGDFQILINRDPDQVLYPADEYAAGSMGQPVCGPDLAADARDMRWFVDGRPGDVFRIEYQLAWEYGVLKQAVTFRRIGRQELSDQQMKDAAQTRYFIVGSWNGWRSQEMRWNDPVDWFEFELGARELDTGLEEPVMFQILMDNDWRLVLHPEQADSTASDIVGPSDHRYCDGVNWLITPPEDAARAGVDIAGYLVRLHMVDTCPVRIDWVPRSPD